MYHERQIVEENINVDMSHSPVWKGEKYKAK